MLTTEIWRNALAGIVLAAGSQAQSENYTSIDVVTEKSTQIGYHASIKKDCTAGPVPEIHVITAPKSGTLSVRRALLTTGTSNACPNTKTGAYVLFYQSRPGITGSDFLAYQLILPQGEISTYNISIEIKAAPKKEDDKAL
jgi:hypothetical protein